MYALYYRYSRACVVVHSLALYVNRSVQAVKRKKGPGQTVKSSFRAESSGQDRFQAVKNLDPGREWSIGVTTPCPWDGFAHPAETEATCILEVSLQIVVERFLEVCNMSVK